MYLYVCINVSMYVSMYYVPIYVVSGRAETCPTSRLHIVNNLRIYCR